MNKMPIKVKIFGGDPSFISPLSVLDLENPEVNGEIYDNWASSVKDFPEIINHKVIVCPNVQKITFSTCRVKTHR